MVLYAIGNKESQLLHVYHETNEIVIFNGRANNLNKVLVTDKDSAEDMLKYLNKHIDEFTLIDITKEEFEQFKVVEVEVNVKI